MNEILTNFGFLVNGVIINFNKNIKQYYNEFKSLRQSTTERKVRQLH